MALVSSWQATVYNISSVLVSQRFCGRGITVVKSFVCRGVAGIDVSGTLFFELSIGEM